MIDAINLFGEPVELESKYSFNVTAPQYAPSEECPKVFQLYSNDKCKRLIREIESSNVTSEEKEFLKIAATRHIVFNYKLIADYYSHASAEMQKLMENNALVIIDFDDAVANGYVELTDKIHSIAKQSKVYKDRLEKYNLTEV